MNEWNIQSRAHVCEACAQPFADQQPYHTLLRELAPELRRSDICEPCWQKQFAGDALHQHTRGGIDQYAHALACAVSLTIICAASFRVVPRGR